jgi:pimeloyl-ACP methyl ester carboxylesterase
LQREETGVKKLFATIGAIFAGVGAVLTMRRLNRVREDTRWEDARRPGKIVAVDGVALHYIESPGAGVPVVMIHGFGGETFTFRHQMSYFAPGHRCVAIDLKGFGYSERAAGDYSLVEQARLMLRAMDVLNIKRAILIGHSMGGEVVLRMAEQAPDRVEKLVLVATPGGYPARLLPRMPFMKPFMPLFARMARWNIRKRLYFDPSRPEWDEALAEYERPGRIYGSLNTVWEMWRDVRKQPRIDYARITMPVLILWAERDKILPFPGRLLKWLRARLPMAEVLTIPRTGHMLLEENPDAANEAIRRFIGDPVPALRRPGVTAN